MGDIKYRLSFDYNCEIFGEMSVELVRYVFDKDDFYEDERILLYKDLAPEYLKEFKKSFYKNCSNYEHIEDLLRKDLRKFENLVDDMNNVIKKFNSMKEDLDIDVFRCDAPIRVLHEIEGSIMVVADVSVDSDKRPQVDKISAIGSSLLASCVNDYEDCVLTPRAMLDNFLYELNKVPKLRFMEADIQELKSIVNQDIYDMVEDFKSNISGFNIKVRVRYANE
jgi:hypothetical protein